MANRLLKRIFFKSLSAGLAGFSFVCLLFILLNLNASNKDEDKKETFSQFVIKPPVKKKEQVKLKKKPKPKKANLKPNMQSMLRGMSFGLPAFEMDWGNDGGVLGGNSDYMDGSRVDKKPKVVYRAPLSFPQEASSKDLGGYVTFGLFIDALGKLKKVEVLDSEPKGIFDQAALDNINTWKFEAAEHKGIKVATWQKQRIVFAKND